MEAGCCPMSCHWLCKKKKALARLRRELLVLASLLLYLRCRCPSGEGGALLNRLERRGERERLSRQRKAGKLLGRASATTHFY